MHTVIIIKSIFCLATIQYYLLIDADNTSIFWFVVYLCIYKIAYAYVKRSLFWYTIIIQNCLVADAFMIINFVKLINPLSNI